MSEDYDVSSRSYLARAKYLLASGRREHLFHAAFELRAGIEARLHEYIVEWEHIPAKSKKAWQVGHLDAAASRAFAGNRTVVDVTFESQSGRVRLLYTPVRQKGRVAAEKLGNYLHAQKRWRAPEDAWWDKFRSSLKDAADELSFAVSGTLLGPALRQGPGRGQVVNEIIEGQPLPFEPQPLDRMRVHVQHHPAVKFCIPDDAYAWRP